MECLKNGASLFRLSIGMLVLAVLIFFSARVEEAQAACNLACMTFKAKSVTIQPDAKLNNYYQFVNDCLQNFNNNSMKNADAVQTIVPNMWMPCTSTQVCPFFRFVASTGNVVYILGQGGEASKIGDPVNVDCWKTCVAPASD